MTQTGQKKTNFKAFKDLRVSLRAGAASGMNTVITLEPESAIYLADILEVFDAMAKRHAEEKKQ